jgi:hypothetical protein
MVHHQKPKRRLQQQRRLRPHTIRGTKHTVLSKPFGVIPPSSQFDACIHEECQLFCSKSGMSRGFSVQKGCTSSKCQASPHAPYLVFGAQAPPWCWGSDILLGLQPNLDVVSWVSSVELEGALDSGFDGSQLDRVSEVGEGTLRASQGQVEGTCMAQQ